jgi:hypothetical protein
MNVDKLYPNAAPEIRKDLLRENDKRAQRAVKIVADYEGAGGEDPQTVITDIINDLLHLHELSGQFFPNYVPDRTPIQVLNRAWDSFQEEHEEL